MLREMIPGPLLSNEAAQLMQNMMVGIAEEIGTERFHSMILKAIETCDRRPTIAKFRMLAGLNSRLDQQQESVAAAWALVTQVVCRHVGRDAEGNVHLQSRLYRDGDVFREEPVPHIPDGVRQAVRSMGGWGALAESYPAYWGMRFVQFKELLRLNADETLHLLAPTGNFMEIKNKS